MYYVGIAIYFQLGYLKISMKVLTSLKGSHIQLKNLLEVLPVLISDTKHQRLNDCRGELILRPASLHLNISRRVATPALRLYISTTALCHIHNPHQQSNNPKGDCIAMEKITMLTIKEAAELVAGLTEYRIRQMCIDGTLPHIKAGKKYLINRSVLLATIGEPVADVV
jgi:excisionase family DNA binding protein